MRGLIPFLIVGAGGALGSMARYGVALAAQHRFGLRFPWGTVFVNITGSFLIAVVVAVLAERSFPNAPLWRLALVSGFLGGYTTFSSFVWESERLLSAGEWLLAAVNLVGSVAAGLLAFRLGSAAARAFF